MKTALLFIFAMAIFTYASAANAQTERLSEGDYNISLAKGLEASSTRNRRIFTTETFYSGSQVVGSRKIVSEFAGPDTKRIRVTEEFGDKRSSKDSVQIGSQFYCKVGQKDWQSSDDCSNSVSMAIPVGNYEYFEQPDPTDPARRLYTKRAKFVDSGLPKRDAVRLKFIEIKFAADDKGLVEYTETRRGGIEPNGWSSTQVSTYEYDPGDMKIADPTKDNL